MAVRPKLIREDTIFFRQERILFMPAKGKTEVLPAGNYEYPIEFIIPGNTPESIEGLGDSYVVYRFKATLERRIFSVNIQAPKVLHVVRTLSPVALELSHEMVRTQCQACCGALIISSCSKPPPAVFHGTFVLLTH
jgi:hypothetical protein